MLHGSAALAVHADWSVDAGKRWMAVAGAGGLRVEPVGDVGTLLRRLRAEAEGRPVALGVDFPLGLPREYARLHAGGAADFPAFLRGVGPGSMPGFMNVCATLDEVSAARPFYPQRGAKGMTRLAHAAALGLADAAGLSRMCDRATAERPAGAPLFWTLGANQTGKAALSAWRDLLLPSLDQVALWPFAGPLLPLLQPGRVVVAETYPAEAMRQLGLRMNGSKRRQADRQALGGPLRNVMAQLGVTPDTALSTLLDSGFGADAAGEDRFDCVLGVLCVLQVLAGRRTDAAPADPWVQRWEGWVLGQAWDA